MEYTLFTYCQRMKIYTFLNCIARERLDLPQGDYTLYMEDTRLYDDDLIREIVHEKNLTLRTTTARHDSKYNTI